MRRFVLCTAAILVFFVLPVFSVQVFAGQPLETLQITSSPNPLGSGARALGFANAFIAVADDATAASWNPGGLMQLGKPELSMAWYASSRSENYLSESHPESSGSKSFFTSDINFFSMVYPVELAEKNMNFSLSYQRLYDLNKNLKLDYRIENSDQNINFDITSKVNYEAQGGIKALSPAYAFQVTEYLSLGVTVNILRDIAGGRNGWREKFSSKGSGLFGGNQIIMNFDEDREFSNLRGVNYNMGLLWRLNELVTIGAVYKTPFKAEVDRSYKSSTFQEFPGSDASPSSTSYSESGTMEIRFPSSYGLGMALRFSDAFTVAFDLYRTEWSEYMFRDSAGNESSPIDGRPKSESEISTTTQIHLGMEYLFIFTKTVVPVRTGIFVDPEPGEGESEKYYGAAFGTGISLGDVILDTAYQYRRGTDVEGDALGIPNTSADVVQHTFYVSTVYHF